MLPAMETDASAYNRHQVYLIRRRASISRHVVVRKEARQVSSFLAEIADDIGDTQRHLSILTTVEDVATQRSRQLFTLLRPEAVAVEVAAAFGVAATDVAGRSRSRSRSR